MSVMVLGILRIEVVPATFDLTEGESTQISVSPNLIRDNIFTVTINIFPTEDLDVTPTSLIFNRMELESQTVTVTATNDMTYDGDRPATLLLSADDYAATIVTVNITEDDLQTIGLRVVGATDLNLVRFTSTDIRVRVAVATTLDVETTGAVRLADGSTSDRSTIGVGETQIQIQADSVGEGTVTFTVGGARQLRATAVVTVMVSTPTLMISASGVDELEIQARQTTDLTVTVNVAAGDTDTNNVTVTTTTVMGNMDAVSVESPVGVSSVESPVGVSVGTPTIFTVEGLDAGDATLRLTANHPFYKSASIDVSVSVYLPPVGLSVTPSALEEIVIGRPPEVLTITTVATATVTIEMERELDNIINIGAQRDYLLNEDNNNEIEIAVEGVNPGRTTLTITADAVGYVLETTKVTVEVLDSLRIEVDPATFDLEEGSSQIISVRPNRIDADRGTVTVMINLEDPDGSGLTVSTSSLTFTAAELQTTVRVTEMDDSFYTDPRIATLTLSATGYASTMVTINITDDELPPIGLRVTPPELEIVRGTEMVLTITTATTATITISEAAGADDIINDVQGTQTLNKNDPNNEIEIEVMGLKTGRTTLMITAEAVGYEMETTSVNVMVLDPLRIQVNQDRFNLVEGSTPDNQGEFEPDRRR